MIRNEHERKVTMDHIERLVKLVEDYDRRVESQKALQKHDVDAENYHEGFTNITLHEFVDASRHHFETYLKGSLGHPLDDSGPRGVVFFRGVK